ncbi:MAG TPA: YeeE/YedE thiosulfate transporter family protein, partial [Thermoanaerobaculia bacterium]|nr:YeeE/YedE thiosulfate transporter family protein [Thermoanaerobaculia bacterium]
MVREEAVVMINMPHELGLVISVLIGVAFGFVLERAGFGQAKKLAAQFYLRDMTVFKVMFSAIVTAMLGLVIASSIGLVNLRDISESIVSFTYVWPMLFGGLLLGAGFIVSGDCPGTSIGAGASGNVDGMFAFGGVVAGTFIYSELLQIPKFQQFHTSGDKGSWFLYDLVRVPPQLIAAVIAVMAIAAFIGAERVEKWVNGIAPAPKKLAFATLASTAAIALVAIALPVRAPAASLKPQTIAAAEVSKLLIEKPWTVQLVDTRSVDASVLAELPDYGRLLVVMG